ncbi:MAG TPA: hypothetical protein VIU14_10535 [Mesorhizobium sp.]
MPGLADMLSVLATLALYGMLAIPFAVWTGRSAYGRVRSNREASGRAGLGRWPAFWLAGFPACLLAYFALRGFDVPNPTGRQAADEWGQVYFLLVPPCIGMIMGCVLGWILACRR